MDDIILSPENRTLGENYGIKCATIILTRKGRRKINKAKKKKKFSQQEIRERVEYCSIQLGVIEVVGEIRFTSKFDLLLIKSIKIENKTSELIIKI